MFAGLQNPEQAMLLVAVQFAITLIETEFKIHNLCNRASTAASIREKKMNSTTHTYLYKFKNFLKITNIILESVHRTVYVHEKCEKRLNFT